MLFLLPLSCLKVADLQYNTIATGHGPILRYNVESLVGNYRDWSMAVEKGAVQVGGGGVTWGYIPWISGCDTQAH